MKHCDYCKEEVKDEAIKCKHCGSMIYSSKPFLKVMKWVGFVFCFFIGMFITYLILLY